MELSNEKQLEITVSNISMESECAADNSAVDKISYKPNEVQKEVEVWDTNQETNLNDLPEEFNKDVIESPGNIQQELIEPRDAGSFIEMEEAKDGEDELLHDPEAPIGDDPLEDKDKSRFNLRKRIPVLSNVIDYGSDDFDNDVSLGYYKTSKKLKFSLSKKNYRRQRPYTNEAVKIAVKMVQAKKMSLQEASREFKIPRTSLHNFVQLYKKGRRIGIKTISPGLTKQEESEIVSLVMKLSRCGKRYSHNELRFLVQYYLISNDRPVFKSGTLPTMGWIAGLVERQKELTKAKSKKNTKVAAEDVEEWQIQIEDYLINDWDLNIAEMFRSENSNRIFCFNAFRILVNSPGENADNKPPSSSKKEGEDDKTDIEAGLVLGISADGRYLDPMVILPDDKRDECGPYENEELRIMFNATGRVDEEAALRIVKDFDDYILSKDIVKPVAFFVNDKHDLAHFSVIEYCWENQIIIICLPPKTTKTMTPFEISIWPKIRSSYSALWKNAPKCADNKINIGLFPELFMEAWDSVKVPKNAIRGFIKSGLIPFNVPSILKDATDQCEAQTKQQIQAVIDKQKLIQQELDHQTVKKEVLSPKPPSVSDLDEECDEMTEEIQFLSTSVEEHFPESSHPMEERSRGKLEGIEICLKAIESFIPPDVMPVWSQRGADYRGRCELAFKLWRSVSLLLKAGCAMASIQQMSNGFFNPFGSDFTSTASFFQKSQAPSPSLSIPTPLTSPVTAPIRSPSPKPNKTKVEKQQKPVLAKKRKLKINKSIYSKPSSTVDMGCKVQKTDASPFVKLYPSNFLEMHNDDI